MKLYESLVRNIGIGKEALVRQWIKDNTRVGDDVYTKIVYKEGKIYCGYIDLFLKNEMPDYIDFEDVRYCNMINVNKRKKLRLNPAQLPTTSNSILISNFDLTDATIDVKMETDKLICIADCICKNTIIDIPDAELQLCGLDGLVKGISSKNATSIHFDDKSMNKLVSNIRDDVNKNICSIFKNFPALVKIRGTEHIIRKIANKWVLD